MLTVRLPGSQLLFSYLGPPLIFERPRTVEKRLEERRRPEQREDWPERRSPRRQYDRMPDLWGYKPPSDGQDQRDSTAPNRSKKGVVHKPDSPIAVSGRGGSSLHTGPPKHREMVRELARLVLDCTYKTNKWGMPLLDILGVDGLDRKSGPCQRDPNLWEKRSCRSSEKTLSSTQHPSCYDLGVAEKRSRQAALY